MTPIERSRSHEAVTQEPLIEIQGPHRPGSIAGQSYARRACLAPRRARHPDHCLVAILDLYSRKVLSFRVSNAMSTEFCVEAPQEALTRYGTPEIVNTDQGTQFTASAFIEVLKRHGIAISMDGRGSWKDNVFIERFWRTLKYEAVYLKAYETVSEARASIANYVAFYSARRPHSTLGGKTPDTAYFAGQLVQAAA